MQYICEKYNISHYAYDVVNKCFLKHVTTHRNYPVLCYYAVNNHQYLIKDTKKIKSLVEKAKDQKSITFFTSILQKKEIENIYLHELLENIPITELTNYKNEIHNKIVAMYSRKGYSDISDLLYE